VTTSVYHLFVDDKDSKFRFVEADRGVTRGIGSIDASPAKVRWFERLRRDYRRAIGYPSPLRPHARERSPSPGSTRRPDGILQPRFIGKV
jgi:hypothetical protein